MAFVVLLDMAIFKLALSGARKVAVIRLLAPSIMATTALGGCSGPAAHETSITEGRIVAREKGDGGPSGEVTQTVAIPVGGVAIPLAIASSKSSSPYFLYTIQYGAEKALMTQSMRTFQIGECVRLWHAPLAASTNTEYKFVTGTLEKASGCQ